MQTVAVEADVNPILLWDEIVAAVPGFIQTITAGDGQPVASDESGKIFTTTGRVEVIFNDAIGSDVVRDLIDAHNPLATRPPRNRQEVLRAKLQAETIDDAEIKELLRLVL